MVLRIPCPQEWPPDAVTLVTQFSISRLARFERTLAAWDGPISLTVYLTDETDIAALELYLLDETKLAAYRGLALTIVKPDYSVTEAALLERLRYPINKLRNFALNLAPTPYVVVTDADFLPSPDMHALLSSRGVPLIRLPSTASSSPTLRRTAVVVSAFVLSPNTTLYPSTPFLLSQALSSHPPLASLTDLNAGHGPSLPSLLFHHSSSPSRNSTNPSWSYEICYEPQWEPYYLIHRASHPLYDERFTDQGGDKQAHALLLNALGYEFRVLRDVWFMHPPKDAASEDEDEDEWPSARLVDPDLEPDAGHHAGVVHPAHFSVAQRDGKRWRYFQDLLPEMERVWGANVRWPRGCGARVVGVRSFGRARSGVAFGM